MRVEHHPILGEMKKGRPVTIYVDGKAICAFEGEPVAAALLAAGIRVLHLSAKRGEPRGLFCALGRCSDCIMTVDGRPNVRTCITPVRGGMVIETQRGVGRWNSSAF